MAEHPDSPEQLDSAALRRTFGRAAPTYDAAAILPREIRERLLERLRLIRSDPLTILDLGAGTGHGSRALKDRFASATVVALDFALPMLLQARRQQPLFRKFSRVCASAFALPLRSAAIDWCVSNLALAWCEPVDRVLAEVQRVLKPGGLFSFTSFGPDTLRELRAAWASVDRSPHVHRFLDMHELGDELVGAGFAEPVMDVERVVLTYTNLEQFFSELKQTGFATATAGRPRHLGMRKMLRTLVNAYEPLRVDGRLPVTFEIVYGQAWRGHDVSSRRATGEVSIPIESIGRRKPK
jgi:malonyl-CoA O-methyltransferase